jgi:hypothetical protein
MTTLTDRYPWLVPGAECWVLYPVYGSSVDRPEKVAIERVTKTQARDTEGNVYRPYFGDILYRAPRTDWGGQATLHAPDSPEVLRAMKEYAGWILTRDAQGAANNFADGPTIEKAEKAIRKIQAWVDARRVVT